MLVPFLLLLMGIFDFARGIYAYNAVSQAAREIARTTSVHRGAALGASPQSQATVAAQQSVVPGMQTPVYSCVDIEGNGVTGSCFPGNSVKVTVTAPYQPVTPLLAFLGNLSLSSSSTVQVQQ